MSTDSVAQPTTVDTAVLLRDLAYNIWSLSLGNRDLQVYHWLKNLQPGDLVVETSSAFSKALAFKAVGRLQRKAREPFPVSEDWPASEPVPLEDVWYIQNLDGSECRWTNASFCRVPESVAPWRASCTPSGAQPVENPPV